MRRYLLRLAVAGDQWINTVLGGNPDETISSRVGRAALRGHRIGLAVEAVMDWIFECLGDGPGHCRRHIEWDETGA